MIFAEREEAPGIFQKNGPGERGGARCGSLFFYSHSCPHGGKALFPPRRSHSRHFHSCHAISMGGPSRSPPIGKPGLHRKTSRIESVFPSTKLLIIAYNDGRVFVRFPAGRRDRGTVFPSLRRGTSFGKGHGGRTVARRREKDIPLPYLGWNQYLSGGGELEWRRKT